MELEEHSSGYRVVEGSGGKPKYQPLSGLTSFVQRFPVSRGLDHPNEIAAYMFADVFTQDYLTDDNETEHTTPAGDDDSSGAHQAKRLYVPFRPWCRKNLRLDWEGQVLVRRQATTTFDSYSEGLQSRSRLRKLKTWLARSGRTTRTSPPPESGFTVRFEDTLLVSSRLLLRQWND